MAADVVNEENTGLKTSIADTADGISYRGSAATGTGASNFQIEHAYRAIWDLIDPSTGALVDWGTGQYRGLEIWLKYGPEFPAGTREGCVLAIGNIASTIAIGCGTAGLGLQHRIVAAGWSVSSQDAMTWTTDSRVFGTISVPMQGIGPNVLLDLANATQVDDAESPARVQSTVTAVWSFSAEDDLQLLLAMGGDIDVKAYYRLIKTPSAPA
tara:strand:- start:2213 stop:2848 length:636 start_codon:yes stop_codon:yes gene_type:complete